MIAATAGHVDHGKSTLVRALTGTEPDRWQEEHRRGLTIDLGFAALELQCGQQLAFVDVPGHERFSHNLLAGCANVDLALFVVSAREGWRTQSEEHLWTLDLLGVETGIVAVTHADVVSDHEIRQTERQVRTRLEGTFLAGAPMVRTAPGDTAALARLTRLLNRTVTRATHTAPQRDHGQPRLWVDRSFTVAGAGRVVTGVLEGGRLSVGDRVVAVRGGRPRAGRTPPASRNRTGRVRSLQRFGVGTSGAGPGERVAVNLANIGTAPQRGDALICPAAWELGTHRSTQMLHAILRMRVPAPVVRATAELQIAIGTALVTASVKISDPDDQRRGEDHPASEFARDRRMARVHLSRAVAPVKLGDRFLIRDPGHRTVIASGVIVETDTPPTKLDRVVLERRAHLAFESDGPQRAEAFANPPSTTSRSHEGASQRIQAERSLRSAVTAHPDRLLPRSELRRHTGLDSSKASELIHSGMAVAVGDRVTVPEVLEDLALPVRERLSRGPATASELRRALGWSRRHTIELLEALDDRGITVRDGNHRHLGT